LLTTVIREWRLFPRRTIIFNESSGMIKRPCGAQAIDRVLLTDDSCHYQCIVTEVGVDNWFHQESNAPNSQKELRDGPSDR